MIRKLACSLISAALLCGTAHAAPTLNGGGSSAVYPLYAAWFAAYTRAHPADLFSYAAAGSGAGQNAFLTNKIDYFEPVSGANTVGYASRTLTYGTIAGTQVDFGASDAPLVSSQFAIAVNGSYDAYGITLDAYGNPIYDAYGNYIYASATYGPLIQIPILGEPVSIAYNQSALTTTLPLTDAQVCHIFSGDYTTWNQVVSTLPATPITLVYRTDSSGTTYLLTQHLAAVCGTVNGVTFTAQKVFASEFPSGVPSNFVGESGSGDVASELVATAGSIGALSPAYTSIAPLSANTTSLKVASLYNATTATYYQPTVANTELGLEHAGSTSTNLTAPSTNAVAMNPLNWVPLIATTTAGYPIVGYTTLDLSSCYSKAGRGTFLINFLTAIFTTSYNTTAINNGFAPLSNITGGSSFVTAIADTFLSNAAGYTNPLNIDGTECSGLTGR